MPIDLSRRETLKAAAAALTLAGIGPLLSSRVRAAAHAGDDLTLWYEQPAREWVEALPLGNGRLGAMVFGGVARERLQLNEDTLYAGGPYDATPPEAREALPEVRRLIFAGRYAEAEALANAKMMARPIKQMPYQPLVDLLLDFDGLAATTGYRRELDLDAAVARTRFVAGEVTHTREVFVSPVDQCLVVRLAADVPGALRGRVSLQCEHRSRTKVEDGALVLRGRNGARHGVEGRLKFTVRVHALATGGSLRASRDGIEIRDADEVVLLLTAATSYRRYDDVSGDPDAITQAQLAAAAGKPYAALRDAHLAEHRRLFRRVAIDLGRTDAADRPTDERVRAFAAGDDPALAALFHQYGRYLLIGSSRPGSQPANLQGIWNDRINPPWESKYTININTEMNYWPSEPTALPECVEPLVRMVRELAEAGARTARTMYGARGWVAHHNTDLWRQTSPIDGAKWGLWPTGGAWLCQPLWERWAYGRDPAYLREIYPLLKGAAEFFVDTLVEDPNTGAMVTVPSLSPENVHPHGASICAGPAMDAQILRDLFGHCIAAAAILDTDAGFAAQLTALRERLPPHKIGAAGQLQEWQEDWDLQAPEIDHRHVSHLYALYPSDQINVRDTLELAAAAKKSLQIRGDEATGWGIGWRLNLWARLGDGEHAYRILQRMLQPDRTYPNLFDAHPPFQIDGNFGATAGITEMLLQSWGGTIFLLPALPSAWPTGSVRGLRARGAAGVDLSWKRGRLAHARLASRLGGRYAVAYRDQTLTLQLAAGETVEVGLRDQKLVTL